MNALAQAVCDFWFAGTDAQRPQAARARILLPDQYCGNVHRNAMLERPSTPAGQAFLRQSGSGF